MKPTKLLTTDKTPLGKQNVKNVKEKERKITKVYREVTYLEHLHSVMIELVHSLTVR